MNSWCGVGRLTRDVELYSGSVTVGKFILAIDRRFKKEGQPTADFIPVVVFGKQAENCAAFIGKGRLVGVSGRIQTSNYQNKEGQTVYKTEIIADNVQFLDYAKDNKGQADKIEGFTPVEASKDDLPF